MARNYLIGIGGTGARVIEAVVHCCAAGFGPRELSIMIVDPDKGNGNLSRTTDLIASYQKCRLNLTQRTPGLTAFGTEISTAPNLVWNVLPGQDRTLADFINYTNAKTTDRGLSDMMELLFSKAELEEPLSEGFRGHPSIGAVAMSASSGERDDHPWKKFWADLENSQGENDVRVFLVGSIFGGTGAAGVPTFGAPKILKFSEMATIHDEIGRAAAPTGERSKSKILLGASLVLPYFTIDQTEAGKKPEEKRLFVTAADFPIATKAALQYYTEKNLAFDQLYLIGDSLGQAVGGFSAGNQSQANRPHYIELVTALAAFDFYRQDITRVGGQQFFAACRDTTVVDWNALPVTRNSSEIERIQQQFKLQLGALAVFAYSFATLGQDTLARDHSDVDEAWYRKAFSGRKLEGARNPRTSQGAITDIVSYSNRFLRWVGDMDDAGGDVRLIDRNMLFPTAEAGGSDTLLPSAFHKANIGSLLKGQPSDQRDIDDFHQYLQNVLVAPESMNPTSRYVATFYEAAVAFTQSNWRFSDAPKA